MTIEALTAIVTIVGVLAGLGMVGVLTLSGQLATQRGEIDRLWQHWKQTDDRVDDLEEEPDDDESEPIEVLQNATHEVCDNGRAVKVRKVRTHYGVDSHGKEWPLFIASGRRGYTIRRLS